MLLAFLPDSDSDDVWQDDLAAWIRLIAHHIDHQAIGFPIRCAHSPSQHLRIEARRECGPRDHQGCHVWYVDPFSEQSAVADHLNDATAPAGKQFLPPLPTGSSGNDG